jgi:hypothetical protein
MPDSGGLKGEMASGDAHPYLGLFHWQEFIIDFSVGWVCPAARFTMEKSFRNSLH